MKRSFWIIEDSIQFHEIFVKQRMWRKEDSIHDHMVSRNFCRARFVDNKEHLWFILTKFLQNYKKEESRNL